jgi:hypothetical protein
LTHSIVSNSNFKSKMYGCTSSSFNWWTGTSHDWVPSHDWYQSDWEPSHDWIPSLDWVTYSI